MKHHILPHDGPPPRAWGRPLRACVLPSVLRSTPTRVGTTLWLICRQIGGPVHPHARGDDVLSPRTIDHRGGPPPRAWGRLEAGDLVREQNRSTPTRVGTTPFAPRRWSLSTVHPHARGDDAIRASKVVPLHGPPPRAWGRRQSGAWLALLRRSTPTRVGTTPPPLSRGRRNPVHPHARGDDMNAARFRQCSSGPPPRAWGRQRGHRVLHRYHLVHPHARGDDTGFQMQVKVSDGPPPRAWGRRAATGAVWRRGAVHPHARGDDGAHCAMRVHVCGPPPRAWGRPARLCVHAILSRSTPTRVGTTHRQSGHSRRPAVHPHARGDDAGLRHL